MTRWHVVVTVASEGCEDVVLRLDRSPITIGGSATSDVVLAGPHVSRSHAIVTVSAGRLVYRDRSSNGSFIDGRRVEEHVLAGHDVVNVPPYRLSFALNVDEEQTTQPLPDVDAGTLVPASARADAAEPRTYTAFQMQLTKAPGDLHGRTFSFDSSTIHQLPIVVGRAADAHLCLELQSVSRRHAALAPLTDGRWQISDGGSRNGI